jgi:hypothetical protein
MYPARKIDRSANSLVARAKKMLEKRDSFLLVFDVKGTRNWHETIGTRELFARVDAFCKKVNRLFGNHIVSGELNSFRNINSFDRIIGDGGGAYLNDAETVRKIMEFAKKELYPIEFWWNVAKDIWDKKNSGIIA